uniref:Uncharacterized protein n=1 Tax=Plectus sambesii TaxID=2011161 RepID=A0A914VQX3_9BILA
MGLFLLGRSVSLGWSGVSREVMMDRGSSADRAFEATVVARLPRRCPTWSRGMGPAAGEEALVLQPRRSLRSSANGQRCSKFAAFVVELSGARPVPPPSIEAYLPLAEPSHASRTMSALSSIFACLSCLPTGFRRSPTATVSSA